MTQKIFKVGSSAAVTLSKRALESLGLKVGDKVTVDVDAKKKALSISPADKVNAELIEWTKGFIERYRPALDELSKK